MLTRLFRKFPILLLLLSILWLAAVFGPAIYYRFSPESDFQDIIVALQQQKAVPVQTALIQRAISTAGSLNRAIQLGYYTGVDATLQANNSHTTRRIQVSYLAWFQKLQKPTLLIIERRTTDGGSSQYVIAEGKPSSLAASYAPPVLLFAFSLFVVLRKKTNPSLVQDAPSESQIP